MISSNIVGLKDKKNAYGGCDTYPTKWYLPDRNKHYTVKYYLPIAGNHIIKLIAA